MINLLYHGNQILSITNAVGTGVLDGPIQYKSYFAIDLDCRGRQSLQMYILVAPVGAIHESPVFLCLFPRANAMFVLRQTCYVA